MDVKTVGDFIELAKSRGKPLTYGSPTFTCMQARKDLDLIAGAAAATGIPVPLAAQVSQMIEACIANGSAEEDYAAMIKAVERSAGLRCSW